MPEAVLPRNGLSSSKMFEQYSHLSGRLSAALSLQQAPVALSFSNSLPDGVSEYDGRVPAGCRFWQEATQRSFATSASHHALCGVGVYTHNLEPTPLGQTDLMDALKVFGDLGYVRPEDLPNIPVLQSRFKYVVYGPLSQARQEPDLILLIVNASQSLILSEAAQQVDHQNAPAMGRPACAVVPEVINGQRAALSLGCCGARAYLDLLSDNVTLFALPWSKIDRYLERIEVLASANKMLARFHELRRGQVETGETPTVQQSLALMKA
jgi:uncharacterized protein (DUF169 family)